jgi:hypothetical protein
MEETVTIGIAFRGHRDSVPLYRDSVPLHRDSVPPAPLKPAPTHAFSEANRPLPFFTFFYLFLPYFYQQCLSENSKWATRAGHPLGVPHLRRLPLTHKDKPPVRLEPLGGTPRSWIHEPQRGKPLASPMHRLRLRLAGGKGVSLALHS